ncbi:MAG: hypothetical protein B9S32_11510 [Verrucomicrobia bacterium Tous-C9LFEB]|nr:MAG: hypothetical protein B9S32_11510 [Verrucomicrobia bacterium Tous-C9LFEB]
MSVASPASILSPFATALRQSWRKPLRTPQFLANAVMESWSEQIKECRPGAWRPRTVRRLYNRHGKLTPLAQSIATATKNYSLQAEPLVVHDDAGVALVFMLRSFGYAHAFHNYMVAHALKDLGYHVQLIQCDGLLESCGSGSSAKPTTTPPYLCKECRTLAHSFYTEPFQTMSLDEFASKREDLLIELIEEQKDYSLARLTVDGLPIGRWMQPYLLRYVRGHREKISLDNPEVLQHVRGVVRLVCRYQRVLARFTPSCAVFFNGLFAPEAIFYHMSTSLGVATICTERGPKKNTLFLSREAACHYRAEALWASHQGSIGEAEIAEARASVESRTRLNLDPSGRPRPIEVSDSKPYDELAKEPYVVFFPPVFHDTASMEKPSPFADVFGAIDALCKEAIRRKVKLVIRSHPDEAADTSAGAYRVHDFLAERGHLAYSTIHCLKPEETWNAYLLAEKASATVVYNGTLGMELPALGYRIFNIAQSHYAGKGFTEDVLTPEDLAKIFDSTTTRLDDAARTTALRYWYFYYNLASLPVGSVLDEKEPSQFELNTHATTEEIRSVRHAIRERVELLLKQDLALSPLSSIPKP